jgi:hypothetical protein
MQSHYYVTPETALKSSQSLLEEGNWEQAIEILYGAIRNKRNRGNNNILEKVVV